jgi:hypothetical protein
MPFTVTFTATAFVAGSLRSSGNTLLVDDPTARMLVDLGVATAPGLTAQTGAVAPNLARLDGATFTGKINTPATTAASAFLNLPHGTVPSAPVNGDLFTTTFDLGCRINGTSRYFAQKSNSNTFSAGQKQTVSHSSTTAGFNVGPVAGDPTTLANGDVWLNSTTNNLIARINGGNQQLNAVKAWVNFNGTGTVAIRSSFNVSSITDNAVGNYTVNFTNAFANTNYSVIGMSKLLAGTSTFVGISETGTRTTSSVQIQNNYGSTTPLFDIDFINVAVFA